MAFVNFLCRTNVTGNNTHIIKKVPLFCQKFRTWTYKRAFANTRHIAITTKNTKKTAIENFVAKSLEGSPRNKISV